MQKREEDSSEKEEEEGERMCVCVREAERSCVCMHETELHGCVACVTKSLSWMTYKEVNVHAVRELIQRSAHTLMKNRTASASEGNLM